MADLIIDISNNNQAVNWNALVNPVQGRKVAGVIAKASESHWFTDEYWGYNRTQASKHGLPIGAYHFARPTQSNGVEQALHFCEIVQKLKRTDIKPWLDFEDDTAFTGLTLSAIVGWIHDFGHTVKRKLGVFPGFYSFTYYIHRLQLTQTVGDGLWQADYGIDDGHEHPFVVAKPWTKAELHQFASKASWPGVKGNVDLSFGSLQAIRAFPWTWRLG